MSTEAPVSLPMTMPPVSPPRPARVPALVVIDGQLRIPASIRDLTSFRHWALSQERPEARLAYLAGMVWVDRTMEQLYTHNQVKQAVGNVLGPLAVTSNLGLYVPDVMRLSNEAADLSTQPDALYVSYAALQSGRVRQVPGGGTQGSLSSKARRRWCWRW
jgi:hypothetical protein